MNLKTVAAVGTAFGILGVGSAFATFARIESMGKNTTYIMDDVSIFDNPANINLYSNYLIGEFGPYTDRVEVGANRDPQHPNFGGIFSIAIGGDNNPDPRISIGGLFGRINTELFQYLPDVVIGDNGSKTNVPETVTNFDGFLGGTLTNGNAWGLHVYIAAQDGGDKGEDGNYQVKSDAFASVVQADGGMNFQFTNYFDLEFSLALARIQYGPEHHSFFDDGNFSWLVKSRAFFTLDAINGELVPALNLKFIDAPGLDEKHAQVGIGINVALDRGFFWMGADFIWNKRKAHDWIFDAISKTWTYDSRNEDNRHWDERTDVGGMISFGIERNIWWDWFVIRVGGQKSILYTKCDVNNKNVDKYNDKQYGICKDDGNFFSTNPLADGTSKDHVGFGFGINIEEKLKIDVTVAEDLLFRNPFQGEGRLFSRISATYSF
ncbi:hypothetical protein FSU_2404 [Fibrobacter succinogenes subsp. succinogenes S85]|jgi:hypothetical protein|uniref:Membrane protein n=1 Tax=Fibrobacter succinogenes (strain ATCC 19169 / S85) TaxID=59374 RepID=A7UG45_FIBSS|nr:hypothetical protein [Fibrobacter succinogenes]ABU45476.1 membrane protein [Fibrobacter succinogenes subsp. succinogenes S85]ACX75488.1 hypothetical protein Fisuc_1898 [Fibrobacter succinogenes subsp. succinogenes S85]ADL26636.1 hypothetical protein FSU_2404 [Fibrobacter succinogenes subsp. succinogenes S85]